MDEPYTDADEKALAMSYAYTALVKTLVEQNVIRMDELHANLLGATFSLERVGETGAAKLLRALHDSLERIPNPPGARGRPKSQSS